MLKKLLGGILVVAVSLALFGCKTSNNIKNSPITTSGPRFYKLDGSKVATAYKMGTNNKLKRVEYEITDLISGQNRARSLLTNTSDKNIEVKVRIQIAEGKKTSTEEKNFTIPKNSTVTAEVDFAINDSATSAFVEVLDSSGKLISNRYLLARGPRNISYIKDDSFSRTNPTYRLSWSKVGYASGYQVYVEDKLVETVETNEYTISLKPYTAYKIEVRAILENNYISTATNPIYLVTEDTVESQDQRMEEWNDNRFGMFIHWGGYAALGGKFVGTNASGVTYTEKNPYLAQGGSNGTYSEWIKFGAQIKDEDYKKIVESNFIAENFSADEWVRIAKRAGMKYIILTSKHHEGLSLFSTKAESAWTTADFLSQRDFVKELLEAGAKAGIRVGVYYSQAIDWVQKGGIGWTPQRSAEYDSAKKAALKKDVLSQGISESVWNDSQYELYGNPEYADMVEYNRLVVQQVEELMDMKVSVNGKEHGLDTLWWDMGNAEYPEFNYNIMKTVIEKDVDKKIITNNRMLHRDEYTTMPFDFVTPEQSVPSIPSNKYWETCMTMNDNWGYAAHDNNWKSSDVLIKKLIQISSMGGNFLLNVGPDAKGEFPAEAARLLDEVGAWMDINSEAIYGTSKSPFLAKLPWGSATQKENKLYLHIQNWNQSGELIIPGLISEPKAAYVITGKMSYSDHLTIMKDDAYEGYVLSGDALMMEAVHQTSTTVVLEFDSEEIETISNPPKLPIVQDKNNPDLYIDALDSTHVGDGPLQYEDGFGVSHWDDPNDYMKWNVKFAVPGTYQVRITYATGANGGTFLPSLSLNGTVISSANIAYHKSHATEGWVTFVTSETVEMTVSEAGLYELCLKRSASGDSASIKSIEFILVN